MKLNILGRSIKLHIEKNLKTTKDARGLYFEKEGMIFLDADLKGEEFNQTLIHEMIHALISRNGACNFLNEQAEEMFCDTIATVIVDNFKLKLKE